MGSHIAELLTVHAAELGRRWRSQARAVAPSLEKRHVDEQAATQLVAAVAASLRPDPRWQATLIRAGWHLGASAYRSQLSLHHLIKELDLLAAILLYAAEQASARYDGAATASDGIAVARRLDQGFALLSLSGCKGFTQVYLEHLRGRYRMLRHDLRNPLGTIRSAASLMADEGIADDVRARPRFQAMVVRNAKSMDAMIGEQLGDDATTQDPAFASQRVALGDVARTVRRAMRVEAREMECEIVVHGELPVIRTDSTGFELVLRSVMSAVLEGAAHGTRVSVGLAELREEAAVVRVAADAGEPPGAEALAFAQELAKRDGGRVVLRDGAVYVEVPISAEQAGESAPIADAKTGENLPLSGGQTGENLPRAD